MAALGVLVGAVFPSFAELLGVPAEHTRTTVFRAACLIAGLVLGAANWLLTRRVVGRRLRLLADRLDAVAHSVGCPGRTAGGSPLALVLPISSADDLAAMARAFNSLLAALDRESRFRSVVQATGDVILLVDPRGGVSFVSDSVTTVLGWAPVDLVGAAAGDLVHPDDLHLLDAVRGDLAHETAPVFRVRHREGGWRQLEVTLTDRRDDAVIGALVLTARDVTERLELQQRLAFQAMHDALTGLPNRASLLSRGAAMLARADADRPLAVVLMDLDRFKEINDTLGHGYGDRLLAQVGPRLEELVRDVDVVARLGGDEFALLLPDMTPDAALATAARLRAALADPFQVDGLSLDVDASVGVALSRPDDDDAGPASGMDALLREADIAMYAAKELHTGVELYDPAADARDSGRLVLLSEFRRGLAADQVVVHYQPKVALPGGQVIGVEALVRWQHPVRGLLGPAAFLPAVEQTGLIEPLTDRVLDLALAQTRRWADDGLAVPVAVNLSARSLQRADLPDRVLDRLAAHGLPGSMLRLEVTESALLADPTRARTALTRLHDAGVGISIDDFGTGYASMGYLRALPVDELKIDRSFVAELVTSPDDAALVRSVMGLAHGLGLTVVAEGVEDAATVTALELLDCHAAQGYLFARPQPAEEMTRRLVAGATADDAMATATIPG
jgi:diguanylate cyclase (GGDEF)-like protein/PAS domain S-box-containing protein